MTARRVRYGLASLISITLASVGGCNSGMSDATPLSDLTDADAQVLCEELRSGAFGATREQICTFDALVTATDEAMCVTARDACVEMEPPPGVVLDCADSTAAPFEACTSVTVGDLRACNQARAARAADVFGRSLCTNAGTDEAPTADELSTVLPECEAVDACRM